MFPIGSDTQDTEGRRQNCQNGAWTLSDSELTTDETQFVEVAEVELIRGLAWVERRSRAGIGGEFAGLAWMVPARRRRPARKCRSAPAILYPPSFRATVRPMAFPYFSRTAHRVAARTRGTSALTSAWMRA